MGTPGVATAPHPSTLRRAAGLVRGRLADRRWLYATAFLVQAAIAPFFVHDWDGFVFMRSVEQFLAGTTPYQVAEQAPNYIFLNEQWPSPNAWFAYPPLALFILTPGLATLYALDVTNPALLRLGLKLPVILGNLLLAWVVGKAVSELGGSEKDRRRAEAFTLFNPFLIFVGPVWGMFDAWMMVLLLASLLLLARQRYGLAGVLFGAAALVKIFPLFVSPVFFIWAVRTANRKRDVAKFVGAAVATFAAVSLPFFLTAPFGFWNQTLYMHMERPLQGFTLLGLLYAGNFTHARFGFDLWPAPPEWVGPMLSSALLIPALLVAFAYATSGRPDPRHLVRATTVTLVLVLLVSKVVNEQYFVMPIALLTVLAFSSGGTRGAGEGADSWSQERRRTLWALRAWSIGGLVAGLLLGFHWLTFIPHDVAPHVLGMQPSEAIYGLGVFAHHDLGIHPDVFYVIPDIVSAAAVVPAFVLSGMLIWGPVKDALAHVFAHNAPHVPRPRRGLAVVTSVMLVVGPLALAAATAYGETHNQLESMPELSERMVGVTYYTWWNNPSRDPEVAYGNWQRITLTPSDGYFTTNGHQIEVDVKAMRETGIDFAAVSYHGYDHNRYEVFAKVARAYGLHFAPLVEASEVLGNPAHATVTSDPLAPIALRPTDRVADVLAEYVRRSLEISGSEAFLRIDGKPVVFVNDGHLLGPSWEPESRRSLAETLLERYNGSISEVSAAWGADLESVEDLVARFPADVSAFHASTRPASDWRWALDQREAKLWERVRVAAGKPIYLVGTDSGYFAEMATELPYWSHRGGLDSGFLNGVAPAYLRTPAEFSRDDNLTTWARQTMIDRARWGEGAFATVHHAFDDSRLRSDVIALRLPADAPELGGDTYSHFWSTAESAGARRVLIASWNNFFDGSAIQPSKEYGDRALAATREHVARFKSLPPEPEVSVLAIVNEWGGLSDVTKDKKDWTFSLSLQLPWKLAEARPGTVVDVAELNHRLPQRVLERSLDYAAIWVEVGSGKFRAPPEILDETHATLMYYVHHGGSLVLLGGGLAQPFEAAYLADGRGNVHAPDGEDLVRVTWREGGEVKEAAFPDTDRYPAVNVHTGCVVIARFDPTGDPAAWKCPLGDGTLIGTAFRPQGWDYRDDPGALELLRFLEEVAIDARRK